MIAQTAASESEGVKRHEVYPPPAAVANFGRYHYNPDLASEGKIVSSLATRSRCAT
jgi:hypothetical protein